MSTKGPCWEEDTLSEEELRQTIAASKSRGMELELEELAKRLLPTDEYRKACQRAVLVLKTAFQDFVRNHGLQDARMDMAGSAAQHTELEGSDLDVVCFLPGTADERELKMASFWDKVQGLKTFEVMDATRLFPHACCYFSVKLWGTPRVSAHVFLETEAESMSLDAIIRNLCDSFHLSRDLVRMVKFWAANHGLAREGYMNGVAWTAFVLCFLQRRLYVPPISKLPQLLPNSSSKPSLTELLRGFFQFVCEPQATTPRGMSLEAIDCTAAPPPASHVGPPPPLYIEDPVRAKEGLRRNLAATLQESQYARVLEEARRIADRLDPQRPQRWFYWAEVFDPQGLTGSKRLPKLSESLEETSPVPTGAPTPAPAPRVGANVKGKGKAKGLPT